MTDKKDIPLRDFSKDVRCGEGKTTIAKPCIEDFSLLKHFNDLTPAQQDQLCALVAGIRPSSEEEIRAFGNEAVEEIERLARALLAEDGPDSDCGTGIMEHMERLGRSERMKKAIEEIRNNPAVLSAKAYAQSYTGY